MKQREPKKIWVEYEEGCWPTVLCREFKDVGEPYIRADIVDGLVEALEKIAALEDTEEDEWDAVDRVIPLMVAIARTALQALEEGSLSVQELRQLMRKCLAEQNNPPEPARD